MADEHHCWEVKASIDALFSPPYLPQSSWEWEGELGMLSWTALELSGRIFPVTAWSWQLPVKFY